MGIVPPNHHLRGTRFYSKSLDCNGSSILQQKCFSDGCTASEIPSPYTIPTSKLGGGCVRQFLNFPKPMISHSVRHDHYGVQRWESKLGLNFPHFSCVQQSRTLWMPYRRGRLTMCAAIPVFERLSHLALNLSYKPVTWDSLVQCILYQSIKTKLSTPSNFF